MSAAGSGRRSRTAAAGTSASRRACAPAATPAWFAESASPAAAPWLAPSTLRRSSAMRAGRATAMNSPTPAASRYPNRPSCPSRRRPGWSRGCTNPRRPSPIRRRRWRPRNRCPTRRSQARAPSARWHRKIRGAGSAAGCCTSCCAICRLCRRRRALRRRERFLAQPAHGLTDEEISLWVDEVLAVTEAPDHAALFAEGSRAEVPLIGTVKTPRGTFTVSGQVDRLAVSEREVLIVDYKTNRPPPQSASGVALAYRRQLALYRTPARRHLSRPHRKGFSAVDSGPFVDGNRCRNARKINALRCRILTRPTAVPSLGSKGGAGPSTGL